MDTKLARLWRRFRQYEPGQGKDWADEILPVQAAEKRAALRQIDFHGIPVKIDRPKGYVQKGKDKDGKPWERVYKVDYGYIPKTQGGDGDGLDVFMGPHQDADEAYWFTQVKEDGSFDEWKVVLGALSKAEATKIYTDHIPRKFMERVTTMKLPMMQSMLGIEPTEKIAMFLGFFDELVSHD